jgi:hypothetical protein
MRFVGVSSALPERGIAFSNVESVFLIVRRNKCD